MANKQPDRPPTTPHRAQVPPATVRSALVNRNVPRRRCAQQVRFKDLEEEGGVAPGGRGFPERRRLGAGPGSPHPNRKSPSGLADSSSVVGGVWEDMAGAVDRVAAILSIVPPHSLTPGPARRVLAPPPSWPLSVSRTYSHSLEDILGTDRSKGNVERATPNHLTRSVTAYSTIPHREEHPLKEERGQSSISPALSQPCTDSSPCPLVSMVTGSNGPNQSRRQQLGRTLSDPGKEDQPCAAPPPTCPPCVAPPIAENPHRGLDRGGAKQAQLPLPPLPPPPPPYRPPNEGSCSSRPSHTPPSPRACRTPRTPSKVAPAQGASVRERWGERIKNIPNHTPKPTPHPNHTPNPAPQPNHTPNPAPHTKHTPTPAPHSNHTPKPAPHRQANDSWGSTDPPLTPDQARMLKEVERLLGDLVSGDRGGDGPKGGLLGPQGPMSDVQGLKTRLQSLEGLLETSHDTIRLLLQVIQDLELKEGQSERKAGNRTNQKKEGRGTSTDNACVIYSVENDFRLQEGSFTQSWMKVDSQISDYSSAQAILSHLPNSNPRREEPPLLAPRPPSDRPPQTGRASRPAKKSRRKCFWFL